MQGECSTELTGDSDSNWWPYGLGRDDLACNIVIELIAKAKNIPVRLLVHKSRCRRSAAEARQLAMYLAHVALGRSLSQVGEVFGRDRTTVSYACALIEDRRDDPTFDADVSRLELEIEDRLLRNTEQARNGAC